MDRRDGATDRRTDEPTDGRLHPLTELRTRAQLKRKYVIDAVAVIIAVAIIAPGLKMLMLLLL